MHLNSDPTNRTQILRHNKLVNVRAGFTLVEIIIAILLVSIMSAVVIARFTDGNTFNGLVLRDQFVSSTRVAQQSAMGRADVELRLTPNASGNEVTITVLEKNGTIQSVQIPFASVDLSADINFTTSCSSSTPANSITGGSAPLILAFGELGEVQSASVAGSSVALPSALRLCIDDEVEKSVCVSPAGFAYIGDCDVD